MRSLIILLSLAPFAWASDPAQLHVDLIDGKSLAFSIENDYGQPVTGYKVAVSFGENDGCSVTARVTREADLHPSARCGLPTDIKTGKVTNSEWKARIVYVEFADGMRWAPSQMTYRGK
jgi:hypothetical protein